jgi:hypothetical protein
VVGFEEHLELNAVGILECQDRTVFVLGDRGVTHTELLEPCQPLIELGPSVDFEPHVIESSAPRIEDLALIPVTQYKTTGGPFPDRLPIAAITGKLLMGQYEAVLRWARWAEDAVGEWTGVTPATGATVPPCAFASGWPAR